LANGARFWVRWSGVGDDADDTLSAATKPPSGLVPGVVAGGRYRIVRTIGSGGMGEVFEAEDTVVGGRVALKALRADRASSPNAIERLRREIALARKVTHPNVCRTHDLGDHEGRVFLTMELLEGETLATRIARGRLAIEDARAIADQLIAGLGAAHAAGVVHRDFKSANVVMVGKRAVVTDFGLARSEVSDEANLTGDAAMLGTAAYMAPEQVQARPATAASDIYALGVVLFEMTTGVLPFRGDSPIATASLRLTTDPPRAASLRPDLPPAWDAAIARCLERHPGDRFASAERVAAAMRDDTPIAPPRPRSRPRRSRRR
jgi:serine/threonine protein kinase